jgi:hypothetical protein
MVVSSCPSANPKDRALRTWLLASLESLTLCFAPLFAYSGYKTLSSSLHSLAYIIAVPRSSLYSSLAHVALMHSLDCSPARFALSHWHAEPLDCSLALVLFPAASYRPINSIDNTTKMVVISPIAFSYPLLHSRLPPSSQSGALALQVLNHRQTPGPPSPRTLGS